MQIKKCKNCTFFIFISTKQANNGEFGSLPIFINSCIMIALEGCLCGAWDNDGSNSKQKER